MKLRDIIFDVWDIEGVYSTIRGTVLWPDIKLSEDSLFVPLSFIRDIAFTVQEELDRDDRGT